jgi:hypothetical protein
VICWILQNTEFVATSREVGGVYDVLDRINGVMMIRVPCRGGKASVYVISEDALSKSAMQMYQASLETKKVWLWAVILEFLWVFGKTTTN